MKRLLFPVFSVACLSLVAANPIKPDPNWATVRGQVVWAEDKVPPVRMLPIRGIPGLPAAVADDSLLIDAKSKGVKNVMVWLAPEKDGGMISVAPALAAAAPPPPVTITNAGAHYSPRIVMIQRNQALTFANELPVADVFRLSGRPDLNGDQIVALPAAGRRNNIRLLGEKKPLLLSSANFNWIGGRVGVFNHPYFALTDKDGRFEIILAPVGKCRVYLQHETSGWLHQQTGAKLSDGQLIEIKPGVTDLGIVRMRK